MKLFILSAGTGSRLWPLTKDRPKALIDLGDGTTLLERQITVAANSGLFDEIIFITGYKHEQIEQTVEQYRSKVAISLLYNPFYDVSNNLVSLWLGHLLMTDNDYMISNGDNIYKPDIFNRVYSEEKEIIQITINRKDSYDADDMKVTLSKTGAALRVHKEIEQDKTHAESVGLALVRGRQSRMLFVNAMLRLIRKKEYLNRFWLEIFNALADAQNVVKTAEIHHSEWKEIDFHPDIKTLNSVIHYRFGPGL